MPPDPLDHRLLVPASPADLVPPPRFAAATFATYAVDGAVHGQAAAVAAVRRFAAHQPRWWKRLLGRGEQPGLYLDGSFGVGKTHLLAACFHACTGERRYLPFSDAMSLMTMLGPQRAADLLAADLVCLDEFELDDPTNTRLADLLLGLLAERGCRFVTTSNTVVGELGDGRMAVDLFRAQLVRIGGLVRSVHVPGADHRRLTVREGEDPPGWSATPIDTPPDWLHLDAGSLDRRLTDLPVAQLRRLAAAIPGLAVTALAPFADQLAALRFVNLVDRLYDWRVPLRVQASCRIADLFPSPPLRSAFRRKHRRCQSRLIELCA